MEDIPYANEAPSVEKEKQEEELSLYEKQKRECLKEMKKLSKDRASVSLTFFENFDNKLLADLEEKGFVVKFKLNYDQEKPKRYLCRVKIINPKFLKESGDFNCEFIDSLEENLRNFGFTTSEGETENLKKIFNQFMVAGKM